MMHYKISNLFGYSETSVTEISTSREVNLMVDDEGTTVYVSLANVNPDTIKVTKNMEEDDFLRISVTGSVMTKADKDSNKNRYYSSNFSVFDDLETDIYLDADDANISVTKMEGMLAVKICRVTPKKTEPVILYDSSAKSNKPWNSL